MARAFVLAPHVGRAPPHSAPRALLACAPVLQRREPLKRLMGGKRGGKGGSRGGKGPQKPSDDPNFVRWSKNMHLEGSSTGGNKFGAVL